MNAKLSRRLLKLNLSSERPGLDIVQRIMGSISRLLVERWHIIMRRAELPRDLSSLTSLDFGSDTSIFLPELDEYLRR